MQLIEDTLRGNGITKIPITHNDANPNGVFSSGLGAVDLYEWDSYPNGFDCSNPSAWGNVASDLNDKHLVCLAFKCFISVMTDICLFYSKLIQV